MLSEEIVPVTNKLNVVITGATGMVGEGMMHVCLEHPEVNAILVIGRRSCGIAHPKVTEILHEDFSDFTQIKDVFRGYNAAFFCMGVSSVGMKEEKYHHLTYDLTLSLAHVLAEVKPGISVTYVSGIYTDSSEKGSSMWARVKGKTENHLLTLFPGKAWMFRPGYLQPISGMKHTYTMYKILGFMYPVWKRLFPKFTCRLDEMGEAMIESCLRGYSKVHIEVKDIRLLAERTRNKQE